MKKVLPGILFIVSTALIIFMFWSLGFITARLGNALFWVIFGLWMILDSFWKSKRDRWTLRILGLMLILNALGEYNKNEILIGPFVGVIAFVTLIKQSTDPLDVMPLSLTEDARLKAGITAADKQSGDMLEIVLIDAGIHRIQVIRCLRMLYGIGLKRADSITKETPSILQKVDSRIEADFIVARLSKYGAKVNIIKG